MSKNIEKRRAFFKKVAQTALAVPFLAVAAKEIVAAETTRASSYCNYTCTGGCKSSCDVACATGCKAACTAQCGYSCVGGCKTLCSVTCSVTSS